MASTQLLVQFNDACTALKGITIGAASLLFEEDFKGMIKEGLLADCAILDRNPLKIPADKILDFLILETIKKGISVYNQR